jgi:hypothetical protein
VTQVLAVSGDRPRVDAAQAAGGSTGIVVWEEGLGGEE